MTKPKFIEEKNGKDVWEISFSTAGYNEVSGPNGSGATLGALLSLHFPDRIINSVQRTGRATWIVYFS